MNLQTLQDQRKAEFENGFVGPENHIGQSSFAEFLIEDVKSFISETARLGYVAGLDEARKKIEEKKAYFQNEVRKRRYDEPDFYAPYYNEFTEIYDINLLAISSLITTNQEKV